ncbi:acyl-CoA carboxylase subunit epsilon [Streptomyces sp. NPDC050636]|uniref:acyl-CoA carboxylase subunit epsilon n=1 Tax=Streptomyces sp. NPDC050636 TaxID=3154510 RepID=UPI00343B5F18
MIEDTRKVIRVEKGSPSAEELAAVTAVLLTRAAATSSAAGDEAHPRPAVAGWRRPERTPRSPGPRSWRTGHVPWRGGRNASAGA